MYVYSGCAPLANSSWLRACVGCTTQRLANNKKHVSTSIRKKTNTVREQPLRMCNSNNPKINRDSVIGQHRFTNPECAKTYTDDKIRIIGQRRPFSLR